MNYPFKLLKSLQIYKVSFTRQIQQIVPIYRNLSRKLSIFISACRINVIYHFLTSTRWSFSYHLYQANSDNIEGIALKPNKQHDYLKKTSKTKL